MTVSPQDMEPEPPVLPQLGPVIFRRGIDSGDCAREPSEVMPEIVPVDIDMVPVPELAAAGASGEERGKQRVVQQRPLPVQLIQMRSPAVAPLDRPGFGQNRGPLRTAAAKLRDGRAASRSIGPRQASISAPGSR